MRPNQVGGHAAIALLEAYGVDTVFGIPGVHTLELYRGLADRKMRHIGVRHEQGAGFMADGYARASGRPGVCCLITGPGLMNAATPIGQAYSDSVPVLVLASVNDSADLGKGRGRLHEITDQHAAMTEELEDLAASDPQKLREMQDLWWAEASRYNVLPMDWRIQERFNSEIAGRPSLGGEAKTLTYYAGQVGLPLGLETGQSFVDPAVFRNLFHSVSNTPFGTRFVRG